MKCNKQFRFHKLPISNLWEVYLDSNLWQRIVDEASYRRCTLTWITRYCVFRLIRKRSFKRLIAMEFQSNKVRNLHRQSKFKHRHILCLYGEDEKLLRIAAIKLGITISHLIRLALYWFLPRLESRRVSWAEIFYRGTKICCYISFSRKNMQNLPFFEHIFYGKWSIEDWWRKPRYKVTIPFSPGSNLKNLESYFPPIELDALIEAQIRLIRMIPGE